MKLETISLDVLEFDPNNARKHDAKNLDAIAESLKQFGQRKPIVITKDNVVVAGNGTLEAAQRIGWTDIVCVRTPEDWTPEQVKAFALADNRTAELASWDDDILQAQHAELADNGWHIESMGFELVEEDDLDTVVEVPMPEKAPGRTKTGQLWRLGEHRLYVGDSTKAESFQKLMGEELADLVLTDPPYNVDYHGGAGEEMTISNDNMADDDFAIFMRKAYDQMYNWSRAGAPAYIFHADSSGHIFRNEMIAANFELKQVLIWVKDRFVMGRQDYHWQHEPILYGWKPGAGHSWYGKRNKATVIDEAGDISKLSKADLIEIIAGAAETTTVVREDKTKKNDLHPTMKPINLLARLISNSTKKGDLILDPFAGSGSTLIAAGQLGRRAAIIEMDTQYADRLILRWEEHTGGKAELDG